MAQQITANELRRRLERSDDLMFVCAYDDTAKCEKTGIDAAIPFPEFRNRLDGISKSTEIVFFCA